MTNWSNIFPRGYPLLQRAYVREPGAVGSIVAPAGAVWVRAGAAGAGGYMTSAPGWGGGAAFAYQSEACAPGDAFAYQNGDSQHATSSQEDGLADSWVKRPNSTFLVYAQRGRPDGGGGSAGACTGSVKRSGSAATSTQGGVAAGDDDLPAPMGFGGRGGTTTMPPWYGGGGGRVLYPTQGVTWYHPPGDGMLCIEFYRTNPGF